MLDDGFGKGKGGRAVAFTQYPQYSTTTTGSSLNELWKVREEMEGEEAKRDPAGVIQWSTIDRWPTHPGLVEAFARNIEEGLKRYPEERREKVTLVFSAHSLPMSVVNKGESGHYLPLSLSIHQGSYALTIDLIFFVQATHTPPK